MAGNLSFVEPTFVTRKASFRLEHQVIIGPERRGVSAWVMNGASMPRTPQRTGSKLQHVAKASHLRWNHCTHSVPAMLPRATTTGHQSIKHSSQVKLAVARGGCRSQIQGCYHIPTAITTLQQVPTTIPAVAIGTTLPGTSPVHASGQEVT